MCCTTACTGLTAYPLCSIIDRGSGNKHHENVLFYFLLIFFLVGRLGCWGRKWKNVSKHLSWHDSVTFLARTFSGFVFESSSKQTFNSAIYPHCLFHEQYFFLFCVALVYSELLQLYCTIQFWRLRMLDRVKSLPIYINVSHISLMLALPSRGFFKT